MSTVGKISLDLGINSKGFNKQVSGIEKQAKKSFGILSITLGNMLANVAQKAFTSIGSFFADSIKKGSDLAEVQNVVDATFTTMADSVNEFSKNALDSFGLTELQAKKMMGTFGAMSKAFGNTESESYNMSKALTGLAGDVASFYNLSIDEAYTKMKAVFTGETESLKELGVVMTQAALDEFALSKGMGKTTNAMNEQEKVALRLAFVQDKLAIASGDVVRTSDSWANQTRKLAGQFESLKAALGQGFINILSPVIKMLNELIAKLVLAAQAFKALTDRIMGVASSGSGGAIAEVASTITDASNSSESMSNNMDGVAGSAKKAQKSLMGFDQINKLQKNSDSSGSGGGSMPNTDFSVPDAGKEEQSAKTTSKVLDDVKAKVNELISLFKVGFKNGLGKDFNNSLKRTYSHLESIKGSILSIATDSRITTAASNLMDQFATTLGTNIGSAISIGQSIGENLIGGVDLYLEQNKGFIIDRFESIMQSATKGLKSVADLSQAFSSIFEVFRGDKAKKVTANLIGIFANARLGITDLAFKIGSDAITGIVQPIVQNKDKIKQALESTLVPINNVLTTLNNSIKATFDKIFSVYESRIQPAMQGISDGFSSMLSTILNAYNTYIAPLMDKLTTKFSEVWASKLQPVLNKVIEFIGKIATFISTLWKNVVSPFINWLVSTLVPILVPIIKTVYNVVADIVGSIATILGGIIDALGGIIDFLSGLFTGNWELCWKGVESILEGALGIIEGLISGLINFIIGIFSSLISILGGIVSTIFSVIWGIISTAISAVTSVISTGFDLIKGIFANGGALIQGIVGKVFTTIQNIIQSIVGAIQTFIGAAFNAIKSVISTILNGIMNAVSSAFNGIKSVISSIVGAISSVVCNAFSLIANTIGSIVNGIKNTIGIAFNGILSIIKGIVNGILGAIESMVNGVISGINLMVKALNSLSFDVPDWVPVIGGSKFGFNIPTLNKVKLPRLAEGGYVKKNQPRLAMIGDNRTQGEIVAPENKMKEVMLSALTSFFERFMNMGNKVQAADGGNITIPIYLDGTILDEVIVTAQQRRNLRSGGH